MQCTPEPDPPRRAPRAAARAANAERPKPEKRVSKRVRKITGNSCHLRTRGGFHVVCLYVHVR